MKTFKCLSYLTCLLYLSPLVTFLTLSFSRLHWHLLSLSALLTFLSLCPYSQCGTRFHPPPLLSPQQSHLMQRCLCLILLPEPQDYVPDNLPHGHPTPRQTQLPLPPGRLSFISCAGYYAARYPRKTWESSGVPSPPTLLSIQLMPRTVISTSQLSEICLLFTLLMFMF